VSSYAEANAIQRGARRLGASGPGSWLFARVLHRIDRPVYRATRGRHTLTSLLSGLPVVVLTTTGARSGRSCSVPLVGLPTPDGMAVIASGYGQRNHPGWYFNLRANPTAEIAVDGARTPVRAVAVEGERRARIWAQALTVYPGFSTYERRASNRRIAVFVLEPLSPPSDYMVTSRRARGGGADAARPRPPA
jgi:deazaflavin-dependent oxidoreductase (nitroreductase family)